MAKKKAASTNAATSDDDAQPLTFEQSLEQLEETVRQLEDGELDMDAALAAYEAGLGRLRRCYHLLETAQRKVEQLAGLDQDGNLIAQPFSPQKDRI